MSPQKTNFSMSKNPAQCVKQLSAEKDRPGPCLALAVSDPSFLEVKDRGEYICLKAKNVRSKLYEIVSR
jgi:hypothetical protein